VLFPGNRDNLLRPHKAADSTIWYNTFQTESRNRSSNCLKSLYVCLFVFLLFFLVAQGSDANERNIFALARTEVKGDVL
jgi:hypothetical protein